MCAGFGGGRLDHSFLRICLMTAFLLTILHSGNGLSFAFFKIYMHICTVPGTVSLKLLAGLPTYCSDLCIKQQHHNSIRSLF